MPRRPCVLNVFVHIRAYYTSVLSSNFASAKQIMDRLLNLNIRFNDDLQARANTAANAIEAALEVVSDVSIDLIHVDTQLTLCAGFSTSSAQTCSDGVPRGSSC